MYFIYHSRRALSYPFWHKRACEILVRCFYLELATIFFSVSQRVCKPLCHHVDNRNLGVEYARNRHRFPSLSRMVALIYRYEYCYTSDQSDKTSDTSRPRMEHKELKIDHACQTFWSCHCSVCVLTPLIAGWFWWAALLWGSLRDVLGFEDFRRRHLAR